MTCCARYANTSDWAQNSSSLGTVSSLPRPMSWSGINAVTRLKAVLGAAYEFATGQQLGSGDFEGGKTGAVRVLGKPGFQHPEEAEEIKEMRKMKTWIKLTIHTASRCTKS